MNSKCNIKILLNIFLCDQEPDSTIEEQDTIEEEKEAPEEEEEEEEESSESENEEDSRRGRFRTERDVAATSIKLSTAGAAARKDIPDTLGKPGSAASSVLATI